MKIQVTASLLLIAVADAFVAPNTPSSGSMTTLSAYRHNSYLFDLENLRKQGMVEVNGKAVPADEASNMIDQEIQAVAQDSMQAQGRVNSLEQEINDTKQSIQDAKQDQLQKELDIAIYEERNRRLQDQLKFLSAKLEEEQEHIKLNQAATNRIVQRRVELDQELGELKRKYEQDSQSWKAMLEQEKRAHGRDVAEVQAEVVRLRKQVEELANRPEAAPPAHSLNPYAQSSDIPPTKLNPFVHSDVATPEAAAAATQKSNPFVTTKTLVSRSVDGTKALASRSIQGTKSLASRSLDGTKALASKAKSLASLSVEKVKSLSPTSKQE